jgi:hypothetical protein
MRLHWSEKWITIPYGDTTVVLHGILPDQNPVYQISSIKDSEAQLYLDSDDVAETPQVPSEIQQLLSLFADIFATQISHPPVRNCTHSIPLITGSRQVQQMLNDRLIQ